MPKTALSPFEDVVKQAIEAELDLRELETPARKKLSAKAFIAEAIANAHSSPEKVSALRAEIDANPAGFPHSLAFLRKATRAIRESHMPAPPPSASHGYMGILGRDDCQAELATVNSHAMELFVLAVEDAVKRYPDDAFGSATSSEGWRRDYAAAKERRDELFERVGKEFTRADERYDMVGNGLSRVSFKLSGGAVPTAPFESAGERLVAWAVGHPDVLSSLGVVI